MRRVLLACLMVFTCALAALAAPGALAVSRPAPAGAALDGFVCQRLEQCA